MFGSTMGSSGGCINLPAKIPQFFKIILKNTMQERKLEIPTNFVTEYGNSLPECATLEVPDGAKWQIYLTKTKDGQVWMDQGWFDFANHYSLSHGNLLVFNPQGLSKFLVVIFDMSGTEIKYTPSATSTRSSTSHSEKEFELRKNHEMKKVTPSQCRRPHKRDRANSCDTYESGPSVGTEFGTSRPKKPVRDTDLHVSPQEFKGVGCTSSTRKNKCKVGRKKNCFTRKEKAKLLEITRDFQSSYPCFKALIQPSALYRIHKDVTLEVPFNFALKYITERNGNVILQNMNGRTWSVNYRSEAIKGQTRLRPKFSRGWKDFSIDNDLEVGDVCVFEMIKESEMTFNVVIFRAREREDMSSIPLKPYFKVIMQPSTVYRENLSAAVNIPAKFAKKYLTNEKGDVIIYDVEERTWSVSYYCNESRGLLEARFTKGWKQFAEDNHLRVGDVCVFEMDNCKYLAFKVIIFRKDNSANCFPSPAYSACSEYENSDGDDITNKWSCPILTEVKNEADEFTETYPWFSVEMKISYTRGSYLTLPRSFPRNYIKGTSTVKLNVGDKSWQVKILNYQGGASRFSAGWIAFAKENALKPLDICKFELIQWNDCTFRVSISRNTVDLRKSAGLENEKSSAGDITNKRPRLVLWDEANKLRKVENESKKFTRTHPWFEVEMENAYIQGWCLNVPSSFARNYVKTGASTIKLNVGDKSWRVNIFKFQDDSCKISAGWTAFVKENSLKPNDVCKFELIQRNAYVFRVSISRKTSNLTSCLDI